MAVSRTGLQVTHIERGPMMEKNRMGMLAFIGSEAIFFGMLILAYVYYQTGQTSQTPNARTRLDAPLTLIFSVFLFASSLWIYLAERNLARGNHRWFRIWLVVTILFGAVFLGGQAWEYSKLLTEDVNMATNTFGTTFFTMTGFHGLHVFIGLVMLSTLAGFGFAGKIRGNHSVAADVISMYWHFVDAVWVVIFSIVYLPLFFK